MRQHLMGMTVGQLAERGYTVKVMRFDNTFEDCKNIHINLMGNREPDFGGTYNPQRKEIGGWMTSEGHVGEDGFVQLLTYMRRKADEGGENYYEVGMEDFM